MTDGEAFLLVFVLIYLSDCLVWLTPSGYGLIRFWKRGYFVRRARVSFEALGKGFAVINPLPPFGTVFIGEAWPISLSGEGIAPFSRENPNPGPLLGGIRGAGFVAWNEVEKVVSQDGYLLVNGKRFARCASRAGAVVMAARLRKIRQLESFEDREAAIERWLRERFSENHVRRRVALFRRIVSPMRLSVSLLFGIVFLLVPYAYWRYHDELRFYLVLLASWVLMLQIAIEYFRLHRRFYPRLSGERWQHLILAIVFPHYAIRSIDALSKGFLADSHPLAMARAIALPEEKARLESAVRRDARQPIPLSKEHEKSATVAEEFRLRFFLPALETGGESNPEVDGDEAETHGVAICPRCRVSYDSIGIPCEDCGGLLTIEA
ncbi:MAG: hypothetical protein KDN19_02375 [Verrucomicrobiae bacterium]|nr:hypothetical protein [Verrucomicrobiae bacterium]